MKRLAAITGAALAVVLAVGGTLAAINPPAGAEVVLSPSFNCVKNPDHWKCVIPSPSASVTPTVTPTIAPTASPTRSPSPAPTLTPSPTPTRTPSPTPTTAPTPSAPTGDNYILIDRADLISLPMSGTAWNTLKTWADKSVCAPDLSNQDNQCDVTALAKAIVYARTGTASYKTQAITMLQQAKGSELPGDTLGVVRGAQALALAADFIDYTDTTWLNWLKGLLTWPNPDRQYTIITTHDLRPNNWGTHAFASRVAIDMLINNLTDLTKAVATAKGYMGDRAAYSGFKYGELSWQANSSAPVGINPTGAVKSGVNIDGILPDDMRRGGTFPTVGADGVSYTYEALQGVVLGTKILERAGHPASTWSDEAVCRAFDRINDMGYEAVGDDAWQPALVNELCGTNYVQNPGSGPGKGFGFADWLWP